MIYVVAYDISSDRRRVKVADALRSRGYRIQESVFQLRLTAEDLDQVRSQLRALIDEIEDVVHIYPVLRAVRGQRRSARRRCGVG